MRDGGKGDAPRPLVIPMEQFDAQWEAIFGTKGKKTEPIPFAGYVETGEADDNTERST